MNFLKYQVLKLKAGVTGFFKVQKSAGSKPISIR